MVDVSTGSGRSREVVVRRVGDSTGGTPGDGTGGTPGDGTGGTPGDGTAERDRVVVEEPLEIHLGDELVATTMRTPGHDFELAAGFLWSEGVLDAAPDAVAYGPATSSAAAEYNSVTVAAAPDGVAPTGGATGSAKPATRLGLTSSSCGVCGTRQVEDLLARLEPVRGPAGHGAAEASVERLLTAAATVERTVAVDQELFGLTGGSHAAVAADVAGTVVVLREDIGRHNAVDKVVGRLLLDASLPPPGGDHPGTASWLWVSGRASFEVVQKAWAAGFGAVVAVGAVSALAVEVARRANMTLVGFARGGRATVYCASAPQPVSQRGSSSSQQGSSASQQGSSTSRQPAVAPAVGKS